MPVVMVDWVSGRTKDQKAKVAKAITEAMSEIGNANPDRVYVVFRDVPKEDWATGGVLMADK